MLPHVPRQMVAVAVLLTGVGVGAAAAKPAARPRSGPLVPTVAQAAPAAHPAATRAFQPAPFHSGVTVLSYYDRVPVLPARVTDAQAQALIDAGVVPYYLQAQGPGRTIPPSGPQLSQFRQRELFLNTLIGGENRLISAQMHDILVAGRLAQELAQLSHLINGLPLSREAPFLKLYNILSSQLKRLDMTITVNDRTLILGLKNELSVFKLLTDVAPLSPDVAFYRVQIIDQTRAVDFIVQETGSPFVPPPDRDKDRDRRGEEERERRFRRDRD